MSKFIEYRKSLIDNIFEHYISLNEEDKIKKLKIIEDFIDEFSDKYFNGETFDFADRELIKREGQRVYDEFVLKLGIH